MDDLNIGLALAGVFMLIGLQRMTQQRAAFAWMAGGFAAATLVPLLVGGGEHQALTLAAVALGLGLALILGLLSSLSELPARLALLHGLSGAAVALVASLALLEQALEPGVALGLAMLSLLLGAFAAAGAAVAHLRLSHVLPRVLRHAAQSWVGVVLLLATLGLGTALTIDVIPEPSFWLWVFFTLAALSGIVFSLPLAEREAPLAASWLGVLTGLSLALLGVALELAPLLASGVLTAALTLMLSMELGRRVGTPLSRLLWGAPVNAQAEHATAQHLPQAIDFDGVVNVLRQQREVLLIPGFGCIAAEACGEVLRLCTLLHMQGCRVHLLAHPLAGRLPGQLTLMLREAGASEPLLIEHWPDDQPVPALTLSIGAHDLIDPERSGLGLPDLRLTTLQADAQVVLMLTQPHGFSGALNPLLFDPHVRLLQADAREGLQQINQRLLSLTGTTETASN